MTDLPQAVSQPSLHKSKSETVLSNKRLKEIIYNPDNGLLYLINPSGESFECNLYGHRNTKFKPNFSGMSTYAERVNNKSIKPLDHKMNSTFYHPQGKYFEGYFQFPNPISRPFQNLDSDSTKLVDELKKSKRFTLERNKHLLTLKTNEGLHYLTSSVLVNDEKGRMKLIELIDTTAKEFYYNKELGKPLEYTDAQIRAIKKLKKILLMNNSNKIYKRIMPKPNMKAYEDYYTMHRAISVRPIEKLKEKHKKKVTNLSMDYIIKSKNEKYEDNDLYYRKFILFIFSFE